MEPASRSCVTACRQPRSSKAVQVAHAQWVVAGDASCQDPGVSDAPRHCISYRVDDGLGVASALARELKRTLSWGTVFLDHGSLKPGEPWPPRLWDEVRRADVVLVLIGPRWLTLQVLMASVVSTSGRLGTPGNRGRARHPPVDHSSALGDVLRLRVSSTTGRESRPSVRHGTPR